MFKVLRYFFITITFISLVSCGADSTGEADSLIDIPLDTPIEAPVETPIEESSENDEAQVQANILFIISDDQGLDASAQYALSENMPKTPTLNMLAQQGITFENMWVTPACSTTRSTIITGKYGVNNGVESLPGNLSSEHEILQQYLKGNAASDNYQSAVFGKWHIGGTSETHPNDVGVDYYAGNIGNLSDYYNWSLTVNGVVENSTEYHSTKITNLALDWLSEQTTPWFVWLAYSAPHSPFHLPPAALHSRDLSGTSSDITDNKRDYYLSAIEAMDAEIGRLLDSLDEETRNNTIVIFIGDNGTPSSVIDTSTYSKTHAKGSLYQGGIATPFIVSGQGVTRINERESALITATDLYATIAEIAGVSATKVHDSQSFKSLFTGGSVGGREYSYTAYKSDEVSGWATRSKDYKLIEFEDGSQELYLLSGNSSDDLLDMFSETNNLLPTNDVELLAQVTNLTAVSALIYGDETVSSIDITNTTLTNKSNNCVDYIEKFTSTVNDINIGTVFQGDLVISQVGNKCVFNTNAIPNHDFNDGGNAFPNDVSEQNDQFEITISPTKASQVTPLSLQVDNAILLNGVKVDLLAAGCYGVGNGKIGCNDINEPWRYDPMHSANGFAVDSHNAHAQPDGTYHYHGSPIALFENNDQQDSPVIGFAADGFPIYGTYFDDQGEVRSVRSSYRLKSGDRPTGAGDPGGSYDGSFRDDYEYIEGLGDLDECNGMTLNGGYAYYVTVSYPYVLSCFSGTPDSSFTK
ncbi:YHYH protein [Colwellia psychrerythraea]|uniref:Sulfatase n=1 Tax=Colwellia psychrerythraea TaxID=28229 RepID=A0A099KHI3_COLPS|nr:YHYH protein [Colwellia psychrerythraea]KGJ89705.1 sulfatase [Colwellia psychrerythraea]